MPSDLGVSGVGSYCIQRLVRLTVEIRRARRRGTGVPHMCLASWVGMQTLEHWWRTATLGTKTIQPRLYSLGPDLRQGAGREVLFHDLGDAGRRIASRVLRQIAEKNGDEFSGVTDGEPPVLTA